MMVRSEEGQRRERERKRQYELGRVRPARICPVCGKQYHPTCGDQLYCSRRCGGTANRKRWPSCRVHLGYCAECGEPFSSRTKRATCSAECQRKQQNQQVAARITERYHADPEFRAWVLAQAHARRADKLGLESSTVLLSYLIKRDKGQCQVTACLFPSRKVEALGSRGPRQPSIDHKIPLSKGGTHDLANTQLAHYRCNLSKNNRGGGEQLLLIG